MAITSTTSTTPSTAGTGSSIISSLGSGSGIDTNSLINKLVDVNKFADSNRLTTKQTLLETQISDFGLLRSAFSALESASSALANPDTFNAKSVSVPTTTLLGITKIDAKASVGDYSINVDQIAQAQSISSGTFTSQSAPIGKGTLAIRFGSWTTETATPGNPLPVGTFTVDSSKTGGTITIDDSNNSLTGVRDAINKSGLGLKASILSNNGTYKLLVTAPSGESSEIEITATETPGSPGLASFNLNESNKTMLQQQEGKDAIVRVNGATVTRSTNHLTDVIDGLEFDLFNKSSSETINIGISADKATSEKAIRDFVAAYNTFLTDSGKLVGFDKEKKEYGSLRQDPMAKNLVQQVKSQLNIPIAGLSGGFNTLGSLGIRTELDGTLKIDDSANTTSFRAAIDKNFESVRDFFVPKTSSDNSQISLTKYTNLSTPGTYDVAINTQPRKGTLTAGAMVSTFPLDTTGKAYSFTVAVDGVSTSSITLPTKTFATGAELAADIQSRINADSAITAAKVGVSVAFNTNTNKLEFTSSAYGSASNIDFKTVGADMADLGISVGPGTAGADVSGSVGGVAGFGYGNVLLPAIGSKAEGLSLQVNEGATSGKITFSRGFASSFTGLIDNFLKTNGLIKSREANIAKDVTKVKTDLVAVDKRSESYRARLQAQFSAMESIVRSLKSTGTFLTGAFKALSGNNDN
ncbi:MAG: flagellar hook protein [Gammaproteobacteria bacterium]|nr:MAG: flagellar hook protein [Gammaproteobacteria bacterium]